MITQAFRVRVPLLALCAMVVTAASAAAQISRGGTVPLGWASRWDAAFDSANQVYLLLADGHPPVALPFEVSLPTRMAPRSEACSRLRPSLQTPEKPRRGRQ